MLNKFEIHLLVAGFGENTQKELMKMLSPLAINLHQCSLNTPVHSLPKVHVLLVGLENNRSLVNSSDSDGATQASITDSQLSEVDGFIATIKAESPHCLVYLLAPPDNILSLNKQQKDQYRDFIIFPVNDVFLQKRLFRIVSDLQEKLVQLIKKRHLKQKLADSELGAKQLEVNLVSSSAKIKETNRHLLRLLSNQVFSRMGQRASGRNQELNLLLVEVAKACGFNEREIHDLTDAWHLRNIGKMGFSDKLINTPYIELTVEEQREFNAHPSLSHAAMMVVRPMDKAAKIVLQHKEYLDGTGYPNGLAQEGILKEAQLLSVLTDYTELVAGRYIGRAFSTVEALAYLENYASEKYSDEIVMHLVNILPCLSKLGKGMHDLIVPSIELKPGMQLSRDLISAQGILLMSENLTLDKSTILRINEGEENMHETFKIYIRQKE